MTEVYNEETLVSSYMPSPRPRRQPMASLSRNMRSYSRLSSKGIFGDESPLLLSPLPKYPNKRRSITFADETEATLREERPHYTMWEAGATPNMKSSESPTGRSVLTLKANNCAADVSSVAANQQHGALTTTVAAAALPSTPKRARSNSRIRRAARRKEAELHHGFYDDSFVEDYVLKAKNDIESECMERKKNQFDENNDLNEEEHNKKKGCEEEEEEKEQPVVEINALQKAKEFLLSAVNTWRCSSACPSSERRDASLVPRSCRQALKKELDLLQHTDRAMEEIEKTEQAMRQRKPKSEKCSVSLVAQLDEMDNAGSRKRVRQSSTKKRNCSTSKPPFLGSCVDVGRCANNKNNNDDDEDDDDDHDENADVEKSKMAKLERIIARVIKQQAKRSHGKRSVVVIDWDSVDSDKPLADDDDDGDGDLLEEYDENNGCKRVSKPRKAASRTRKGPSVNKSLEAPQLRVAASAARQQRKPQTIAASASPCFAPSAQRRNDTASVSIPPDLGGDSLLLEEEQPVLLRRHTTTKRNLPARSVSYVSTEAGDNAVFEQWADVSRQPPRRAPAPKATTRRGRKASSAFAAAPSLPVPSVSPPTARPADHETPAPPLSNVAARRRRAAAASQKSAFAASADDPMAIFFDASFPSPSKFDEMMLAAGGLPETGGRTGRGRTKQPALLLPENIYRRR